MTAGFSWDEGLSTLKSPSAAQEAESSDTEDHDRSEKVKLENGRAVKFGELRLTLHGLCGADPEEVSP